METFKALDTMMTDICISYKIGMLHIVKERAMALTALSLNWANTIIAQGAAFADFPLIDGFERGATGFIETGDMIDVDPKTGSVTVEGKG